MGFDFLEGEFVDREVDLEEAVGGVGVRVAENGVSEVREDGMGLVIFVEAALDLAGLIATEEEGLVFAGGLAATIEITNYLGGGAENCGVFDTGFRDRDFAVGAAGMEGKADFASFIVPVEGVLHFVAVVVIVAVGDDIWGGDVDMMLAEELHH